MAPIDDDSWGEASVGYRTEDPAGRSVAPSLPAEPEEWPLPCAVEAATPIPLSLYKYVDVGWVLIEDGGGMV